MKKSLKRKLVLLFCFLYIATDIGSVTSIVNAESKKEIASFKYEDITINGVEDAELEKGTSFDPLSGVEALDKNGVNINSSLEVVGDVDVNTIGEYEVIYTAKDELGESKSITRKVKVVEKKNDTTNIIQEGASVELEEAKTEDKKDSEVVVENNEEVKADQTESDEKSLKITGIKNLTVKLGENINLMDGVKAFDEKGSDLTSFVKTEGEVDFNKVGDYKVKYYIEKEGLPKSELERSIVVVDSKNIINIYTEEEKEEERELAFSIFINEKEKKLSLVNKSNKMLSSKRKEESIFKIKIFDAENNEKLNVDLLGKDTLIFDEKENEELKKKIESLEKYTYEEGDLIQIISSDSKKVFDIKGDILGDITKEKEDYSDGVDNEDYIKNVRFKISQGSLEGVYNKEPVFEGLTDIEVSDINTIDYLKGVKVTDDHDGEIGNDKIVISKENLQDGVNEISYQVTDSWGRTTSKNRIIKINSDKNVSIINDSVKNLANNVITVKGVEFSGRQDVRFKISFDTREKRIRISDKDGRILNNKFPGEYFSIKIYNYRGDLKKSVSLNGTERSNSRKLNEIDRYIYSEGDYISIYHAEADENKLLIAGNVDVNGSDQDYSTGIPLDKIQYNRFQIKNNKLILIENEAPQIRIDGDNPLTLKRGEVRNLRSDIYVTDDNDKNINKADVKILNFDINLKGQQTLTYSYTDSWGKTGIATRGINVKSKSDLEDIRIDFINQQDTTTKNIVFTLMFDDIKKQILVIDGEGNYTLDSGIDKVVQIDIFNKFGYNKASVTLNGSDTGNSEKLNDLNGFEFKEEDKVSIWLKNLNGVSITGKVGRVESNHYIDGFKSDDEMKNVRFNLQDGKFTSIYNEAPEISGVKDITILRGESFDPLEGISVYDTLDGNIDKKKVKVSYDKKSILKVGETKITYTVEDSWGKVATEEAKIIVKEKSELEKNFIEFKDDNNKVALKVGFDDINQKFTVEYDKESIIAGGVGEPAFKMVVYREKLGKSLEKKLEFTIKKGEKIYRKQIDELKKLTFENGDLISVWAHDRNKVSVKEDTNGIKVDYSNGFPNEDTMNNTRFKITSTGLRNVYNNEPYFVDFKDEEVIIKGGEFDEFKDITVHDDIDGSIDRTDISVTEDVDTNTIGLYDVVYKVKDSWGRSISKTKKVYVLSKSEENIIEFLDSNNETAFKIGYDSRKRRFNLIEQADNFIDSSVGEEKVFELTLYDENNEKVNSISLNGNDRGNSDKFDAFIEKEVNEGYTIGIYVKNSSKVKISGDIIKLGRKVWPDYSLGVEERDFIDNVRFRITEDGFRAIYNQAPELHITNKDIDYSKGAIINLLDGVTASDDIDDESNLRIEVIDKSALNEIGKGTIRYKVTDSWGRSSEDTANIDVTNGLLRHIIKLGGYDNQANEDIDSLLDITIDPDEKRLKFTGKSGKVFHATNNRFYRISLHRNNEQVEGYDIMSSVTGNAAAEALNRAFSDIEIQDGDRIKFSAAQPWRLKIIGDVVDEIEDYDDGIQNVDSLNFVSFEITDSGLKSVYEDTEAYNENEFILGYRVNEDYALKLRFNQSTRRFQKINGSGNFYYNTENFNGIVFKFLIENSEGTIVLNESFTAMDKGNSFNNKVNRITNYVFQEGDKFSVWMDMDKEQPGGNRAMDPERLQIKGNVKNQRESYFNGVQDHSNLFDVKFAIINETDEAGNKYGLESIYNEAPKVIGAAETNILVGEEFNPRKGVSISDDKDGNIDLDNINAGENITSEDNITINNVRVNINSTVNPNTVGEYKVTYTVTDSWGRQTIHERRVHVRPRLWFNKIELSNNEDHEVFNIGINNYTGKYEVFDRNNVILDSRFENTTESVFKIQIIKKGRVKPIVVDLKGGERGTSNKLDIINEIEYSEGDLIRVWAKNNEKLKIKGEISGDVNTNVTAGGENTETISGDASQEEAKGENYEDGIQNIDYMNNVGFELTDNGFKSIYNDAPVINIPKEIIEVVKGNENFELIDQITITDEEDGDINVSNLVINSDFDVEFSGLYDVEYIVSDSWGRTSSANGKVRVLSKVYENVFEIYGNDKLKFKIGFNEESKKFSINEAADEVLDSTSLTEAYFKFKVYSITGELKKDIVLNGNENPVNSRSLQELNDLDYRNGDMISVWSKNHTDVKIKGNVLIKNKKYSNGFESEENMLEVRFKVTDDGLEEIREEKVTANGLDNITIVRGDSIEKDDLLVGVEFIHPNEEIQEENITISGLDVMTYGEQVIIYTVVDSWNISHVFERNVIVLPYKEIETQKIRLLDNRDSSEIFTLGFDTIAMKFTAEENVNDSREYYPTPDTEVLFKLLIFDEEGNNKSEHEVNFLNIESKLEAIRNESFEFGDKITISAYDNENGLEIGWEATPINKQIEKNSDEIVNVRFTIEEDGLIPVYNKAPIVLYNNSEITNGTLPEAEFISGEIFNFTENITIKDDHDSIQQDDIIYEDITSNESGEYDITYKISDSWGRETILTRKIFIRAKVESYPIKLYSDTNNELLQISIDSKTNKTKVETINRKRKSIFDLFRKVTLNSEENETIIIKHYNENGEEKNTANIIFNPNSIDSAAIQNEIDKINDKDFTYGDYFYVSTTVKSTTVNDDSTEDNKYMIKVSGVNILDSDGSILEDYSDGIDNSDYMNHVRFRLNSNSVEAIYNEAPELIISNESLNHSKGDIIDLMEGVIATDDKDDSDNIIININDDAINTVGDGNITYTATDSWGRSSSKNIPVTVTNGLLRNTIEFGGFNRISYNPDRGEDFIAMTMRLNHETKRFEITKKSDHNFHDDNKNGTMYSIEILRSSNNGELISQGCVNLMGSDNADTSKLDQLKNYSFNYGDRIKITARQPFRLSIQGHVVDQMEDYSDAVQNIEYLENVEFEITDGGLKSIYNDTDEYENDEFVIAYRNSSNYPLKIKFDRNAMKFVDIGSQGQFAWNQESNNEIVFKFSILNSSGQELFKEEFGAMDVGREFTNKLNRILAHDVNEGDIISIWMHREKYVSLKGLQIKGNIFNAKEDYYDGIQDKENLYNARFIIQEGEDNEGNHYGIKAIYNESPVITGEEFTKVEKGSQFNEMSTMDVSDDLDSKKPIIRVVQNDVQNNINGYYTVKYEATDSWGSTGEFYRDVQVYSMSTLNFKEDSKSIIEVGSMKFSSDVDKEKYLKSLVEVFDEEDADDIIKGLEVENVNDLNLNEPGDYVIRYKVTDSDGNVTRLEQRFQVVKTISVSVPISVPFQVVTNLEAPELTETDRPHQVVTNLAESNSGENGKTENSSTENSATKFVSAVLKIQNNKTSAVDISVKSFNKKDVDGESIEIVEHDSESDWNSLSGDESMKKMALGIYPKKGLIGVIHNENNPVWLMTTRTMDKIKLGRLAGREVISTDTSTGDSTLGEVTEGQLSFVAKHGNKFKGGKTKGNFDLVFEFE